MKKKGLSGAIARAQTLEEVRTLLVDATPAQVAALKVSGKWTLAQIFGHCAQSIEYSLSAYPVLKPALVRRLIGPMLLRRFMRKGVMCHNLAAPVAGAPPLPANISVEVTRKRLVNAIDAFQQRRHGPASVWPEHLVYGCMTASSYAEVHRLHIINHFDVIR